MQHPQNFQEAYTMAKLHDAIIKSQVRAHPHVKTSFSPGKQSPTAMSTVGSNAAVENHATIYKSENAGNNAAKKYAEQRRTRLTSNKEMEDRRANGLCYWCPERYTVDHICRGKHIFVIEVGEDDTTETELEQRQGTDVEELPEISLHVITGTLRNSTMKVEGEVNNNILQLLIDSGNTHMADKLGCRIEKVTHLKVLVANDTEMSCNQICKNFQWCMQGQQFSANVFLVPLKNYQMVLGVQ